MKFKEFIKDSFEEINETVEGINNTGIGFIITYTLQLIAQVHVWHLICLSGQKHTALGELYEELQSEVDKLAEKFIAQGGVLQPISESISTSYDEEIVRSKLEEYRNLVTSGIDTNPSMASIVDSLTELQEIIDSKLYKFNLQ